MARRRVRYQPPATYRPRYQAPRPRTTVQPPELKPWQWRALLALVVTGVIWAVLMHSFAVTKINVEPAVRKADVTSALRTAMAGHPGQGNLLTLNPPRLSRAVLQADPSLSQVQISRSWPHTLNVTVSEKVATIGWESAGQTYILDRSATIIGTAMTGGHLLIVQDDSNVPVAVGKQVATANFVTFCQQLAEQIPNTGVHLTKLEIHDTTFDLYASTDKNYQLIFDTQRGAGEELADLTTALRALQQQHKTPSSYIDLRIAGRAYYK